MPGAMPTNCLLKAPALSVVTEPAVAPSSRMVTSAAGEVLPVIMAVVSPTPAATSTFSLAAGTTREITIRQAKGKKTVKRFLKPPIAKGLIFTEQNSQRSANALAADVQDGTNGNREQ